METRPPNSVRLPLRSTGAPILLKVCCEKEQKAASSSNSRFITISSVEPRMPPPPGVEAEWQMLPKCSLIERLPSPDAPGSWTENSLDWICRMRSLQTLCALSTQPRSQMQALARIKKRDRSRSGWLRVSSEDAARRARLPGSSSVHLCGTQPADPLSQFALQP